MQIVNIFYELARQHNQIKGFIYGKGYEKGAANEAHPLMWLDDPIYGQSIGQTLQFTCNVDILGIPENEKEVLNVQTAAFNTGLAISEKIKQTKIQTGFSIDSFSFLSLRDYYDNNAAGYRFTYILAQANPVDRCANDFDPSKELPKLETLHDFKVEKPDGCAVFNDKVGLPNFRLKI